MDKYYYHACKEDYSIGQILSIKDFVGETNKDHQNRSEEQKAVNDFLDLRRPESYPSRKKCIYLFDEIGTCASYAEKEKLQIYKVRSCPSTPALPFCLVGLINAKDDCKEEIANEYWNPTNTWNFNEYLCKEMTIIEKCKLVSLDIAKGKIMLDLDHDIAKAFFK